MDAHHSKDNTAIMAIYAAAAQPSSWPLALQAVADCFDDVGALLIYQRDDGSFGIVVSPGLEPSQADYARKWWKHDIRNERGLVQQFQIEGDTVTDRHLVHPEEITTHPFFTEFLIPHGLGQFAATRLAPDLNILGAVSVQRGLEKPAYTDGDLKRLSVIARHVEQSLRLSVRLIDAELASLSLADALSRLQIGVFLIDESSRILFGNRKGETLLGAALTRKKGRLAARHGAEQTALEKAVAAALTCDPAAARQAPRPVLLHGPDPEAFVAVYVLPVPRSASPFEALLANTRAIVLVVDSHADAPPEPAIIRDLLGLTVGEARIAALVGSGLSPRDAADRLSISEGTVRTTLKRVFAKAGVSRQSELATLLTRLVVR